MKVKPFGRVAAGIGVVVLAGALAGAARSASAATPRTKSASVRSALSPTASFSPIAVVRGWDNGIWATTGHGFVDLGGRTYDDPAVAAGPEGRVYFLAKGTNRLLYFRDLDHGWRLVENSPILGGDLTAAYAPQRSNNPIFLPTPRIEITYRDHAARVHRVVLAGLWNPGQPRVTADFTGPPSYGAAVNSSGQPLFISDSYTPGLLGPGTLRQWDGLLPVPPFSTTRRYLNCARERLGTALIPIDPDRPFGVAVCKSGTGDSVHFLGDSLTGYGIAHNLGGHIIGSPGIALQSPLSQSSVVYATGTNHHVFQTTILAVGGTFHQGPWVDLGGRAVHGVQASSWSYLGVTSGS